MHPLPEYPRPAMRRDSYENLNGLWKYAITQTAEYPAAWDGSILVPYSPETKASGVGRTLQPGQWLHYHCTFAPPPGEGGRVLLHFGAVDDACAVQVNGHLVGGHRGGRAKNIAVYATSNRRHLIKETLTDRTGDDIHEADTRQELMSLSARFGLTVTFQRPEKARFENILAELAKQHGIDMPMDQLLVKAEAFAIRAGGRSPRVAKQFIEQCEAGVQK